MKEILRTQLPVLPNHTSMVECFCCSFPIIRPWSNAFASDQAMQEYNIYLIIYVCVGPTEANVRGYT